MFEIIGISLLSILTIAIGAAVFVPLILLGITVSVIKFLAPALLALAIGFGIGFGVASKTKEKASVQTPVEMHIEAAEESAQAAIAVPVKVEK